MKIFGHLEGLVSHPGNIVSAFSFSFKLISQGKLSTKEAETVTVYFRSRREKKSWQRKRGELVAGVSCLHGFYLPGLFKENTTLLCNLVCSVKVQL